MKITTGDSYLKIDNDCVVMEIRDEQYDILVEILGKEYLRRLLA
jgi:hypothetical protein